MGPIGKAEEPASDDRAADGSKEDDRRQRGAEEGVRAEDGEAAEVEHDDERSDLAQATGTNARRQGEEQDKNEGPRHLLVAAPLVDEEEIGLEQQERRGYSSGSGIPGHGAEGNVGDERGR